MNARTARRHGARLVVSALLVIGSAMTGPLSVQADTDFTSSGAAMFTQQGMRSLGMGSACVAVVDPSDVACNPATLALVETVSGSTAYHGELGVLHTFQGGLAWPHFGLQLRQLHAATAVRDASGTPGNRFTATELVATAATGWTLWKGREAALAVGASATYLRQRLYARTTHGWASGAGLLGMFGPFHLGFSLRGLQGSLRTAVRSDPIAPAATVGGAYTNGRFTLVAEREFPNETLLSGAWRAGLAYAENSVELRAGLETVYPTDMTLTTGLGATVDSVTVEYAYVERSNAPGTHRFGLRFPIEW